MAKKPVLLTRKEWAECELLWARGDNTLKQLSEKFRGIRPETISQHMRREGIKKGESADLVKAEMENALRNRERKFADSRAERIIQTREEMFLITRGLTIAVAKVVNEAKQKNEQLGIHLNTIKAHKEAIAAVKMGREEVYAILNYDPTDAGEEDLPELVVREMTEEEEEGIRQQQREDDQFMEELREAELENDD